MSFGWHCLLGSHNNLSRLRINTHTRQEQETKGRTKNGWREKWTAAGIYRPQNTSRFDATKDPFATTKPYYVAAKVRASKRRSGLRCCEPEGWLQDCPPSAAAKRASPQRTRKFEIIFFLSAAAKLASPRVTKKYGKLCFFRCFCFNRKVIKKNANTQVLGKKKIS